MGVQVFGIFTLHVLRFSDLSVCLACYLRQTFTINSSENRYTIVIQPI